MESGKRDGREQLRAAIALSKTRQATLLIAKLDRLSRNAGFIFTLRDSGVDFVCADMPEANTLTIGIFAVLAQHERELISQRTRAALQAKREQGFRLGSPQNLDEAARQKGLEVRRQNAALNKANRQASRLVKIYREQGYTFQRIADELNGEGYLTRNGSPSGGERCITSTAKGRGAALKGRNSRSFKGHTPYNRRRSLRFAGSVSL